MRAIGYFRAGDGTRSPQDLETAFLEYCDLNLHQPVETFGDDGDASGGELAGYRRMVGFIHESGSNFLIVVPDAGHLGHDLESVARSVVELEGTGAKVTCAEEELPDPLQNAVLRLGVEGVSRARSERIKESMRQRAATGQGLGRPPHGYRNGPDGALQIVPGEAAVIELIYRLYTKDGLGLRLIAQHLNERDIPTRRGGNWNMVTIRDILKNPTYVGTYTRFGLRLPKSHEAIIPPQVFRAAHDVAAERRPSGRVANATAFLLSGLAHCGYCGNKMMGVTRRQAWKRKDGRRSRAVYRYYQCQSRNNQSRCDYHTWRTSRLEGAVIAQVKALLSTGAFASDGQSAASRQEEIRAGWDAQVRNAERRLRRAIGRAAMGELSIEALGTYLGKLDECRGEAKDSEGQRDAAAVLAEWDNLSFARRRSFLREHVSRIVVTDDQAELSVRMPLSSSEVRA